MWVHTVKIYLLYVIGYLDCEPFSNPIDRVENHILSKLRYTFFIMVFSEIPGKYTTKIL
jgi:hypothetical protein